MMTVRNVWVLIVLAAVQGVCAQDSKPSVESVPDAVKGITARELGGHMKFLASDLLKGRDTSSPETLLAAEYLADHVEAAGAEACGEKVNGQTTFFQHFPLETLTIENEGTSVSLIVEQDGAKRVLPFEPNADFFVIRPPSSNEEIEAPVVFIGWPMGDKDGKTSDLGGLDVKNRVVVGMMGAPARNQAGAAENQRPLSASELTPILQQKGALALILCQRPSTDAAKTQNQRRPMMMGPMRGAVRLREETSGLGWLIATPKLSDEIYAAGGITNDKLDPKVLDGVKLKLKVNFKRDLKDDRNVVAIFPGSDPEKKKEIVIYSAHYDHVGVGGDGQIHNGSDDNASGTSALLEVAQAYGQSSRPARSVAFLWVSGEEKGLLGSEWFTGHMTIPEGYKIVADINMDMVSRNDGKTISIHPSNKHSGYNTLVPHAAEACKVEGVKVMWDADQFYGRTDSYNFAKKGVPIVFFFSGLHEDYHRPTDDVAKADFEKAARIARAAFRLGWHTAQAGEAPKMTGPQEQGDAAQ